jgi:hypothetical protein
VEFLQKGKIKSFPWACFHGHDLVKGQMPVLWPLESIGTPVHWEHLNKNQNQHLNNVTSDLASCNHITLEVPHSCTLWSNAWIQSFVSPLISTIVHHSVLCTRWERLPRVLFDALPDLCCWIPHASLRSYSNLNLSSGFTSPWALPIGTPSGPKQINGCQIGVGHFKQPTAELLVLHNQQPRWNNN